MEVVAIQGFTPKQLKFAEGLSNGLGLKEAASQANVSTPDRDITALAHSPELRKYVKAAVRGRCDIEGNPAAYRFFMRVLMGEEYHVSHRLEAAKVLWNQSNPSVKARAEDDDTPKDLSDMTDNELAALVKKTDEVLKKRGQLIDATPAQTLDNLL